MNKFVQESIGVIGFGLASYGIYQLSEPFAFLIGGSFMVVIGLLSKK